MDVVYNHASQYDLNPLKYTDKGGYYRLDHQGNYHNDSWTGNDLDSSKFTLSLNQSIHLYSLSKLLC